MLMAIPTFSLASSFSCRLRNLCRIEMQDTLLDDDHLLGSRVIFVQFVGPIQEFGAVRRESL